MEAEINYDSFIIYVIDTETTNLDNTKGDVIEVSIRRLISLMNESFKPDQKTWWLKALNPDGIEPKALEVNGHKREDILWETEEGKAKYQEPIEAIKSMEKFIMEDGFSSLDRIFAGQNCEFDAGYLKSTWSRQNSIETFPFSLERGNRMIDTKQLVLLIDICTGRRRTNFHLGGLVKAFSIKKEKAHQAEGDTKMTSDLIVKVIDGIRSSVKEKFTDCYVD